MQTSKFRPKGVESNKKLQYPSARNCQLEETLPHSNLQSIQWLTDHYGLMCKWMPWSTCSPCLRIQSLTTWLPFIHCLGQSKDGKKSSSTAYYETDLDSNETRDLAQVTALLASYSLLPSSHGMSQSQSPDGFQPLTSEIANKYSSQPRTSGNSPGSAFKDMVCVFFLLILLRIWRK